MYIAKIKAKLNQRGSLKSIVVLTGGTVFAQGLMVATTPILTRLFTPSEFGKLAIFMAVVSVVATTVALRYEVNILIPKDKSDAQQLVFLSIAISIGLGIFFSIVAWGIPEVLQDLLGIKLIKSWLPWACFIGMATAINTVSLTWLNRIQDYKQISKIKIMQSVLMVFFDRFRTLWL